MSSDGDNISQESVGVVMDGSTQEDVAAVTGRGEARKRSPAAEATSYRVYKQRWLVLLTVVLLNISNAGVSTVTWEGFKTRSSPRYILSWHSFNLSRRSSGSTWRP